MSKISVKIEPAQQKKFEEAQKISKKNLYFGVFGVILTVLVVSGICFAFTKPGHFFQKEFSKINFSNKEAKEALANNPKNDSKLTESKSETLYNQQETSRFSNKDFQLDFNKNWQVRESGGAIFGNYKKNEKIFSTASVAFKKESLNGFGFDKIIETSKAERAKTYMNYKLIKEYDTVFNGLTGRVIVSSYTVSGNVVNSKILYIPDEDSYYILMYMAGGKDFDLYQNEAKNVMDSFKIIKS